MFSFCICVKKNSSNSLFFPVGVPLTCAKYSKYGCAVCMSYQDLVSRVGDFACLFICTHIFYLAHFFFCQGLAHQGILCIQVSAQVFQTTSWRACCDFLSLRHLTPCRFTHYYIFLCIWYLLHVFFVPTEILLPLQPQRWETL